MESVNSLKGENYNNYNPWDKYNENCDKMLKIEKGVLKQQEYLC